MDIFFCHSRYQIIITIISTDYYTSGASVLKLIECLCWSSRTSVAIRFLRCIAAMMLSLSQTVGTVEFPIAACSGFHASFSNRSNALLVLVGCLSRDTKYAETSVCVLNSLFLSHALTPTGSANVALLMIFTKRLTI